MATGVKTLFIPTPQGDVALKIRHFTMDGYATAFVTQPMDLNNFSPLGGSIYTSTVQEWEAFQRTGIDTGREMQTVEEWWEEFKLTITERLDAFLAGLGIVPENPDTGREFTPQEWRDHISYLFDNATNADFGQ